MHLAYLKYVLRHKWYVFIACRKFKVSLWQAVIHDWHKFLPSEWIPYTRFFYGKPMYEKWSDVPVGLKYQFPNCVTVKSDWKMEFDYAWNKHQKRAPHHWQHWLLTFDMGNTVALEMPDKYIREMLADWAGAGRAITGKWEYVAWYQKNKEKMILAPGTRERVEELLAPKIPS